jgi:hypothetical protein
MKPRIWRGVISARLERSVCLRGIRDLSGYYM